MFSPQESSSLPSHPVKRRQSSTHKQEAREAICAPYIHHDIFKAAGQVQEENATVRQERNIVKRVFHTHSQRGKSLHLPPHVVSELFLRT